MQSCFEMPLYLRPTYIKARALHDLCSTGQTAQSSCAVTRPSSRLVLAIEFDDKMQQLEKRVLEGVCMFTRFENGY